MQYGFALGFQVTRERSKKTKAVSAMQTRPAVCIARGGTKRQNKKPCFARIRFVSFDSDEGPGEIRNPPGSKPQTSEACAVWKGRSGHRGLEPSLAVARSVVTVSDAPYFLSRRSEKESMKYAPLGEAKNAEKRSTKGKPAFLPDAQKDLPVSGRSFCCVLTFSRTTGNPCTDLP